jgi:hypothetical protein
MAARYQWQPQAETDRTAIATMTSKHFIQEDEPDRIADAIIDRFG